VLGVPRSASQEEIRAAYRARMRDYHPDRVAHLGEELQRLAQRKTLEIQGAYERLRES
jgi:DnaJ like chaperone protein